MKKKQTTRRVFFYLIGMLILALGLTLNTKTGLGVSSVLSVPYSISVIWSLNFGNATFVLYGIFVVIQLVFHRGAPKSQLIMDVLQFPLSLVFTRFINLFGSLFPDFAVAFPGAFLGSLVFRILLLLAAVILTGIGAAMTLNMRLIPNPADGIVQSISDRVGKGVGLTKNIFDCCNILLTCAISLIASGRIIGIGLGTLIAFVGVGRTIALFNRLFQKKLLNLTGL